MWLFASGFALLALGGVSGLVLLRRLGQSKAALHRLMLEPAQGRAGLESLERRLRDLVDDDLFPESGPLGFAGIAVGFREPHDPAETAEDLLRIIADRSTARTSQEILALIGSIYQLQATLGLEVDDVEPCLQEIASRLLEATHLGAPVAKLDFIRVGEVVDPKSMWPLNDGTRVRQPLGVALYDLSGKVLNRAKVLCQ